MGKISWYRDELSLLTKAGVYRYIPVRNRQVPTTQRLGCRPVLISADVLSEEPKRTLDGIADALLIS
jgi:hypothetical protein